MSLQDVSLTSVVCYLWSSRALAWVEVAILLRSLINSVRNRLWANFAVGLFEKQSRNIGVALAGFLHLHDSAHCARCKFDHDA